MALPALKEQQFANQLHPVQAQKRKQVRTGQVLQFPTGRPIGTDAAAVRENELSSGERFQAEQARRMADSSAQQDTLGLQLLVDQGVLSQAAFEQATAEAQSYDQPSAPHSGPLPTTKKEACRATGLPSTYEACLNGCARTCGDISQAKCDEVEVPGQDQNFVCYSCSCS